MDNFFTKFLCTQSKTAKATSRAAPTLHMSEGRDSPSTNCEVLRERREHDMNLHSSGKGSDILLRGSSRVVHADTAPRHESPMKEDGEISPTTLCSPVGKHERTLHVLSSEEIDVMEMQPPQRRRVESPLDGANKCGVMAEEEEDDDLYLLLGSQEARRQARKRHEEDKNDELQGVETIGPLTSPHQSSVRTGDMSFAAPLPAPEPIARLPWGSRRADLRRIAKLFDLAVQVEMLLDDSLCRAFQPFLKEKIMDKLERSRRPFCSPTSASLAVALPHPLHLPASVWDDDEDDETLNPFHDTIPPFKLFTPPPALTGDMANPKAPQSTGSSLFTLRDYQLHGVQYILHHFHRGLSCILSDDMGLGKTAQICSFLHVLSELHGIRGPHLIVSPLTTLTNWMRELGRWAPELKVLKYHGDRQERNRHQCGDHSVSVIVTTPALLNQDKSFFLKRCWATVIVDEAHVLKNQGTRITSISRKLSTSFRIAVTGTPIQNDTREVWSILGFLFPQLISRDGGFDGEDPAAAAAYCASILSHIMLRRTKDQLLLGIPPRIDHPVTLLEPTAVQNELLAQMTAKVLDEETSAMQGHLTHQRMVCSHPLSLLITATPSVSSESSVESRLSQCGIALTEEDLVHPSAKMRYLDELLPRLRAEGHRCLIFSNFTSVVDLLEGMCILRGFSYERLDGSCNRVERELSLLRYNSASSSCFVFLITTSAGGVGITLTGADTVILFDANFNPQLDRQAADRAHRIGQTREVHVHRLCLKNTLEEHIRDISEFKASLGDIIVKASGNKGTAQDSDPFSLGGHQIKAMFLRLEEKRQERGREVTLARPGEHLTGATREREEALVQHLLAVERGEVRLRGPSKSGRGGVGGLASVKSNNYCFVCGDKMYQLEALYHCIVCPKSYHADCIGERAPLPGSPGPRKWTCPRHRCTVCDKAAQADGAMFMCEGCPRSLCFDCLPPRFLELDETGQSLRYVKRDYAQMAEEEMGPRRSCYYIRCLRCCGLELPTASSTESDEEDRSSVFSEDGFGKGAHRMDFSLLSFLNDESKRQGVVLLVVPWVVFLCYVAYHWLSRLQLRSDRPDAVIMRPFIDFYTHFTAGSSAGYDTQVFRLLHPSLLGTVEKGVLRAMMRYLHSTLGQCVEVPLDTAVVKQDGMQVNAVALAHFQKRRNIKCRMHWVRRDIPSGTEREAAHPKYHVMSFHVDAPMRASGDGPTILDFLELDDFIPAGERFLSGLFIGLHRREMIQLMIPALRVLYEEPNSPKLAGLVESITWTVQAAGGLKGDELDHTLVETHFIRGKRKPSADNENNDALSSSKNGDPVILDRHHMEDVPSRTAETEGDLKGFAQCFYVKGERRDIEVELHLTLVERTCLVYNFQVRLLPDKREQVVVDNDTKVVEVIS